MCVCVYIQNARCHDSYRLFPLNRLNMGLLDCFQKFHYLNYTAKVYNGKKGPWDSIL